MTKAKKLSKTVKDPETGKRITRKAAEAKLKAEEAKLLTMRTVMGAFSQTTRVVCFLNALGKPIPKHFNQKFYGKTPIWKTASIEKDGTVSVQMEEPQKPAPWKR